jgi:hypothetical protein
MWVGIFNCFANRAEVVADKLVALRRLRLITPEEIIQLLNTQLG